MNGYLKSEGDAAELLGIGKTMLRKLRYKGLPVCRLGRLIRYDMPSAVCWILNHCRETVTSLSSDNEMERNE